MASVMFMKNCKCEGNFVRDVKPRQLKDDPQMENDQGEEAFTFPLCTTRRILSLLGALPCSQKSPYWPSLDTRKANVFYCAVVVTLMTGDALWLAVSKKIQYDEIDPSEKLLRALTIEAAFLMLPHVIVYLIWMDTLEIKEYMKLYTHLQVNFRRLTGTSLKNRKLTIEKVCSFSSLIVLPSFYYLCAYLIPSVDKEPYICMALMYGNMVGFFIVVYWNVTAMNMVDALEDIKNEFKKKDKLTANIVFEFRLLWLSLRALCDCKGRWSSPSFGYSVCMCLSVAMSYEGLTLLQDSEMAAALGHLVAGFIYAVIIFLSCRASHAVEEKMKCLVKQVLPNISLSSYDRGIQREIVMLYLVESARPAVTTFKGLLIVNRNLILTFFSSVSTYIIVLVQFLQTNNNVVI